MSESDQPQTPAEAGKQKADPDTMSQSERNQNGAQTAENRPQKIGEVIDGMGEMQARQVDGHEWRVSTWRNGEPRIHEVDVREVTCTCEDHKYNCEDSEAEVCDHLLLAHHSSKQRLDMEDMAPYHLSSLIDRAQNATSEIENIRDLYQTMKNAESQAVAESQSDGSEKDERPSLEDTTPEPTHDPDEKADVLREAYDSVVDDMRVRVGDNGGIWVQTGMDTPDTLPGPGNVTVFDAFLKNPEQIEYIHDDHAQAKNRPGEWWKNRMQPGKVDEYVSEVLE